MGHRKRCGGGKPCDRVVDPERSVCFAGLDMDGLVGNTDFLILGNWGCPGGWMAPVSPHKHRIWLTTFDRQCDKATCVEEHSLPMAAFPDGSDDCNSYDIDWPWSSAPPSW